MCLKVNVKHHFSHRYASNGVPQGTCSAQFCLVFLKQPGRKHMVENQYPWSLEMIQGQE